MHSTLSAAPDRPCIRCKYFGGWVAGAAAVWCLDGKIVHALPDSGCAYWMPARAENLKIQPRERQR